MHEINVLMEVVDQVEALALENNIERVKAIVLQIGELSPVVPMFMTKYYPMLIEDKACLQDSELVIERIPGEARCKNCSTVYNVVKHNGYCPECKTFDKEVLRGREFIIKELWTL